MLVAKINFALSNEDEKNENILQIGLLDMFGLENHR